MDNVNYGRRPLNELKRPGLGGVAADAGGARRWPRLPSARALLPLAAVVAGGILVHILTSVNLLAALWGTLSGVLGFFGQGFVVPLWLVVALSLTSLFSLGVTAVRVGTAYREGRRAGNPYTADTIMELGWQWRWNGDTPEAASLTPLCPHCAYELSLEAPAQPEPTSFESTSVQLVCESCAYGKRFELGPSELLERVVKEIRRRARLGPAES